MTKRTAPGAALQPLILRVLGGMCVERAGVRIDLPPSKKTRALLGYLLVEPREHTREKLCTLFWDLPDDPRGALRWSLSRLRPLLDDPGRPRIRADRERVQIDAAGALVDLHAAEALRARGLARASVSELTKAAGLFRGELLEGLELADSFRFQAWCTARREEARRLHAEILRALCAAQSGEPEEALVVARRLVELDPSDEAAHREVMSLLGRLQRQREAVAQYDALREILRTAGQRPSPETEVVRRSLGATQAAPVAQPRKSAPASPLLGRDAERAALERAIEKGAAVLLGEPGIGKSRLLEEVAARTRTATIFGRCYEAEQARPYGCFIEALPALGTLLAEPPEALDRARLFEAASALVRRRGATILLDDLQWIDEASAALAHHLARTGSRLALAAREGELADNAAALRLLRALRRERVLVEINLGPLEPSAIAGILESRGLPAVEGNVGNPLLALEMGRALADGRPPMSGVAEALEQRFDALDPPSQSLLWWPAVMGSGMSVERLAMVTGRPPAAIIETLSELEKRGLLRDTDFAHDLMREAAYRRIPPARRKLLHATLARALWEWREAPGTVARQAMLGGDDVLAVRASLLAAQHAIRVFAAKEALSLAQQALPLLPALAREERLRAHLDLLLVCVHADKRPDRLERAAQDLSRVVLEAQQAGLGDVVAEGFHALSQAHYFRKDETAALQGSLRSAEAALSEPDPLVRARALAQAGRCLAQLEMQIDRAGKMLDDASAAAQAELAQVVDIPFGRALIATFLGEDDTARRHFEEVARAARASGDHWRETEALFGLCRLAIERRDAQEALRAAEAVLPVAEQMPEGDEPALARALLALARMLDADVRGAHDASARASFQLALAELIRNEARYRTTQLLLMRAELDLAAGRLDEAAAAAQELRAPGRELHEQMRHGRAHVLVAELALARGDKTEARRQLELALAAPWPISARLQARISAAAARAGSRGGTDAALHRRV
ncbi:MAG: AAA family ATPase [Myxococcales bacterium]|nr:AAA family ATPase [Myxococcales bacterium]